MGALDGELGPARPSRRAAAGAVIALVALGLGVFGYLEAGGVSVATAVYSSLSLFALNYAPPPNAGQTIPVALEVARFLAPVVTVLAALGLAARIFRDEFDRLTASVRSSGHVVVCGLGQVGSLAVASLLDNGHRVVAVERDRNAPGVAAARELGVLVVVGDARDARTLRRAGVRKATSLIWSMGDASEARNLTSGVAGQLRARRSQSGRHDATDAPACLVRVRDLGWCELLRRDVLVARAIDGEEVDVDYFNEWENTAQRLLWSTMRGYALTPSDVDLWIVGGGDLAEALVLQAVRNWWGLASPRPDATLSIHVFNDDAGIQRDRFAAVWPEAAESCALVAHDGPPELALRRARERAGRSADATFVLVDGRDRARELGTRLVESAHAGAVMVSSAGTGDRAVAASTTVFDPVGFGLDSDILLLDTYEQLARMIHERYLEDRLLPDGELERAASPMDPGEEWVDLHPFWRASNRDAARFVVRNLGLSGFGLDLHGPASVVDVFDVSAVDAMAEREHGRWMRFMTADGWTHAPGARDLSRRTNSRLVPWDAADAAARGSSRSAVRDYPRLLAQLGYGLCRVDTPRVSEPHQP